MNLSNLPDECLADMSAPNFESSRLEASDDECQGHRSQSPSESHCQTGKDSHYADVVYNEIVERFKSLRRRLAQGDRLRRAQMRARKELEASRQVPIFPKSIVPNLTS